KAEMFYYRPGLFTFGSRVSRDQRRAKSLDGGRLFSDRPVSTRMNPFHEIVNSGLPSRGPLRVMLPHNIGRVAQNIRYVLKTRTPAQELSRQRMSEAMRVSTGHA